MSRLSILIIPGASTLPFVYKQVVDGVSQHGYEIKALHIPSVGLQSGARPGEPPTMYDDAAFIANHVVELADAGKDVLLITHSYGGAPATESVRGLSKSERQKQGKDGGIVGLAYVTSLVPEVGKPATERPFQPPPDGEQPLFEVGDDGWLYAIIPRVVAVVFSDLPYEEGERWAKTLVPHSVASLKSRLTYGGYKDVSVSYLVCEGDLSISAARQRAQIDMIERVNGSKVDVSSIDSSHVPFISRPNDVVAWILGVAGRYA